MGQTMAIVSAGVSLIAAKQQSDAYKLQAKGYEEQRQQRKLEMNSQAIDREKTLFAQLASMRASAAGRGSVVAGGTYDALRRNERNIAASDVNKIKVMGYSDMRQLSISSAVSKQSAKAAMTSGISNALGAIGTGVQNSPGVPASGGSPAIKGGTWKSFTTNLKNEWK